MRHGIDVSSPGIVVMALCVAIGITANLFFATPLPLLSALAIGLILMFSLKVVRQWEKVAVLRFGRYQRLQGPGLFMIIPVVDTLSAFVDKQAPAGDLLVGGHAQIGAHGEGKEQRLLLSILRHQANPVADGVLGRSDPHFMTVNDDAT